MNESWNHSQIEELLRHLGNIVEGINLVSRKLHDISKTLKNMNDNGIIAHKGDE